MVCGITNVNGMLNGYYILVWGNRAEGSYIYKYTVSKIYLPDSRGVKLRDYIIAIVVMAIKVLSFGA